MSTEGSGHVIIVRYKGSSAHHRYGRFEKSPLEYSCEIFRRNIGRPDLFRVQWGDTADIPFVGWVGMIVTIGEKNSCASVHVAFLVTT